MRESTEVYKLERERVQAYQTKIYDDKRVFKKTWATTAFICSVS